MVLKPKKCRICKESFQPFNSTAYACSPECALAAVKAANAKKHAKEVREGQKRDKQALRTRKAALMTRNDHLKLAQQSFNRFIRLRDAHLPCISCARFHTGKWNAGHYKSAGAHPELRFDESNVHRQCEPCNSHLSGSIDKYRPNLLLKIGKEELTRIEGHIPLIKLTIEDITAIKVKYRAKCKELEVD
jgi:hypothetical protein